MTLHFADFSANSNPTRTTGAPDRTRTCNRRLRRPMLYPVELRAHRQPHCRAKSRVPVCLTARRGGRGRGIRTPDTLLPKQVRYQTALYPAALDPPVRASAPKRGRDGTNAARSRQITRRRKASARPQKQRVPKHPLRAASLQRNWRARRDSNSRPPSS